MMGNLLILIGMGFFIKIFFITAENIKNSKETKSRKQENKSIMIHVSLAIIFILIGRFIVS